MARDRIARDQVRELILDLLRKSEFAARPPELRARMRARGVRLNDYQILARLRELQRDGVVQMRDGRWAAAADSTATDQANPALFVPPAVGAPSAAQGPTAVRPQTEGAWRPRDSWLFAPPTTEEPETAPATTVQDDGPWGEFRRLVDYYVDCVRNDGGCEASANLSDYGKRFIPVVSAGPWFPRPGRQWSYAAGAESASELIRALASAGDAGVLALGYPTWLYVGDEPGSDPFLKPIFTYTLQYEFEGDSLRTWTDEPSPDVNLDWLQYALRDPEQQRAFLAAAGLVDRRGPDESTGDGSRAVLEPEFETLASATTAFFGTSLREPLQPARPLALHPTGLTQTGIYNRPILIVGNRPRFTQSLLRELRLIRSAEADDLDRTALRHIFRSRERGDSSKADDTDRPLPHEAVVTDVCPLNGEQREAVARLQDQDLLAITGPPGTGKSQVVSAAIANARLLGRTVLFASRNHKALDAVVSRPELNPDDTTRLIARANDKTTDVSFGFIDALKDLLAEPFTEDAQVRADKLLEELQDSLKKRGELAVEARSVLEIRDAMEDVRHEMQAAAAKMPEASLEDLNSAAPRFPAERVRQRLLLLERKDRLQARGGLWNRLWCGLLGLRLRWSRPGLQRALHSLLPSWDLTDLELPIVRDLLVPASEYCAGVNALTPLQNQLEPLRDQGTLGQEITDLSLQIEEQGRRALVADERARVGLPPDASRADIAALRVALRDSASSLASRKLREEADQGRTRAIEQVLRRYPTWAVTNLSVRSKLPPVPAMFDVAMLDEASQCDIASAIPILFRARRAGIVGDPAQLQPTTKLTRGRDLLLRRRHGLEDLHLQRFSYVDTSLFDLAAETEGVEPVLLRDHYRCAPEIAEYANRQFYGSRLRVLTAADRLRVPRGARPGIHWTDVSSDLEPRPHGCAAPGEADACLALLEQMLVKDSFEGTVGIVTPFRAQKDLITQNVAASPQLAEAASRAALIIDTAHGFQGDERDVMLLSLCCGPEMPRRSEGWLRNTANLMNVAVTRARAVLHVVGNLDWAKGCGIRHITELVPRPPAADQPRATEFESPWEEKLYYALLGRGITTAPQYPLMGRRLDLALLEAEPPIDIEVDGARYHREPDGSRRRDDIWRDIQIRGAGWRVMRFWVHELMADLDGCVDQIVNARNR